MGTKKLILLSPFTELPIVSPMLQSTKSVPKPTVPPQRSPRRRSCTKSFKPSERRLISQWKLSKQLFPNLMEISSHSASSLRPLERPLNLDMESSPVPSLVPALVVSPLLPSLVVSTHPLKPSTVFSIELFE